MPTSMKLCWVLAKKQLRSAVRNVLPFHWFDAEIKNAPKIGVELTDFGMSEYTMPGEQAFYAGCETVVDMAKRAETMEGADFLCLHFEGADPNGANKSVEECVALAKAVSDAVTMPIVVMGCKKHREGHRAVQQGRRSPRRQEHPRSFPRAMKTIRPSAHRQVLHTTRRSARNPLSTSTSQSSSTPS